MASPMYDQDEIIGVPRLMNCVGAQINGRKWPSADMTWHSARGGRKLLRDKAVIYRSRFSVVKRARAWHLGRRSAVKAALTEPAQIIPRNRICTSPEGARDGLAGSAPSRLCAIYWSDSPLPAGSSIWRTR
jgi:hypothetical protein